MDPMLQFVDYGVVAGFGPRSLDGWDHSFWAQLAIGSEQCHFFVIDSVVPGNCDPKVTHLVP